MPSSSAPVTLIIGDKAWKNWTRAEVESDLLTPADAWSVEVTNATPNQIAELVPGASMSLLVGQQVAVSGFLEVRQVTRSGAGIVVALSGRDQTGPLVDCAPLAWTLKNLSVEQMAAKAIAELGLTLTTGAHADAKKPATLQKGEPGETYWALLERYARRAGLMLWTTRAGVLRIDRPTSTGEPVAGLRHLRAGASNVLSFTHQLRSTGRFSTLTVLGQSRGSDAFYGEGAATVRGQATDAGVTGNRPGVVDEGEVSGTTAANARARWEVGKRQYEAESITAVVSGAGPSSSTLWEPDSLVAVEDEYCGCSGVWFLSTARTSWSVDGVTSTLELHRPGLLAPEPT